MEIIINTAWKQCLRIKWIGVDMDISTEDNVIIIPTESIRGRIQKFPDWVDNEMYAYNNKHSLRSNTRA
jgi:hypothetical protein